MTATFLSPTQITEVKESIASSTGRYINPSKIDGSIRIRFCGSGITGFEGWLELEGGKTKPQRWETLPAEADLPPTIRLTDGKPQIKRFVAGIVYEYKLGKNGEVLEEPGEFKIISITQKSIMDELFKYCGDVDYGDPNNYDIKIGRTGSKLTTEYSFTPCPPKPLDKAIAEAWAKEQPLIDLNAFWTGGDPFKKEAA